MATYYMGEDGKFREKKLENGTYTMNEDGTFSLKKEPQNAGTGSVAGVQPNTPTLTPGGAGTVKNDFAAKAARHTLPASPVTQQVAAKQQQEATRINWAQGISDETRAYDAAIESMEADSERFTELALFYDFYQKDPGQWSEPELAQQAKEKLAEYETYAKKYGTIDDFVQNMKNLRAANEEAKRRNYMQADLMDFAEWDQEDQQMLYQGIQAYADNELGVVGSIERKLYDKYGKENVKRIWESVEYSEGLKKLEAAAKAGQESPGLANTAASLPVSWLGSVMTLPYRANQMIKGGTGRYGANAYVPFSEMGVWAENTQEATKQEMGNWVREHVKAAGASEGVQDVAEGLTEYAFGAGVQIVDTLAKAAAFGGVGTLTLAATTSFEQSYREAAQAGAGEDGALAIGIAKAGLEVLTERIGLDKLLDNVKAGKSGAQAVIDALGQGAVEATTEEINFLGGLVAEALILRDKSGYQQMVQQAMTQGMNYQTAREYATQQLYLMAAETAAMAFAAGAGSSAITSVATNKDPFNAIAQQAQERQKEETAESQTVGNEQQGANAFELMDEGTTQKTAVPEETTVNVTSAGSAINEQNKSKDTLAYTLASNLDAVRDMVPVSQLTGKELNNGQVKLSDQIRNFFKSIGNKVFRNGLGDVELGEYGVGGILNHKPVNRAKVVSIAAVPDVIRSGRQIKYNPDWKGRGYESYTFAAPVTVGGKTVYVAAVVDKRPNNKFYLSEMVDSDGNYVRIEESPSGNSKNGLPMGPENQQGRDYAGPEGLSEGDNPSAESAEPMSHFNNSIRENVPVVNTESGAEAAQGAPITIDELTEGIVPDRRKETVDSGAEPAEAVDTQAPQQVQNERRVPAADESVGAAPSGFDPLSHLQYEYGTIPEGENAVRDDSLPISTDGKDRVSYTARTAMGAKATTDAFAGLIGRETVKGGFSFIPINNSDTVERAKAEIEEKGWENARKDWEVAARTGKSSPELTAIGAILYNNAVNSGAYKTALEILTDYSMMVRNSAQALQAARILKTLTPENRLYMIARTVEKLDEAVNRTKPARRRTDQDNIPVEQWMQKTGEKLAKALSEKVTKKSAEADTVAKTVLKDLRRIANETVAGVPNDGAKRSEMDMIRDLVMNRKQYEEALAAAKETVRSAYGENADVMQALETWMETSLRPDAMFAKELMGNSDDVEKISIPEGLISSYMNAETDEARDEILDEIAQSVAHQIPSTFMDTITALRYMNMLGNLRTQVRNIAGNLAMAAVSSAKDTVATAMEATASKLSGGKLKRTKSFTVSKEQMEAARADFGTFKDLVLDGGKFDDKDISDEFMRRVENKRRIIKVNGSGKVAKLANYALLPAEGYRKAVNWAMEQGDLVFSEAAYARALAGYLKANGITETDYSKVNAEIMNDARVYAVQQAQERTFRDTNWLSGWVSKIGRRKDTPAAGKLISEGIMPFRKTPANILVRAEEYSPLGVINSVVASVLKIAGNTKLAEGRGFFGKLARVGQEITGSQIIDSWAKAMTGSGIFALGMLLKSLGVLVGGPDEDEKKEEFEELSGYQNYALQFGDESYTIDWLTPAAMPLLMGAELWEQMQNGGIELKDIWQALLSISDPMVKMSMLQGIDDTLENISYADSNLGQLAVDSALSCLIQVLTNTGLGQIERSFEDSRMTTYVDKESAVPAWLQRTMGKASAKIPGWDYNQIPYINAWGEEEKNPQWAAGLAYNMFSPGYYEKGVSDTVYKELMRLNDAQEENVFPSAPGKEVKGHNLTAQEWTALAKTQGKTARGIVEDIIGSKYYSGLPDDEKAKAIGYAYDYAREHARVQTLEDYGGYDSKWMEGIEGKEAEAILRKVATGEKGDVDKFADLPVDKAAMLSEAIKELFDKPRETKSDGTAFTDVRTVQKVEVIAQSSLTEKEQKAAMADILDDKAYEKYLKILDAGYDTDDYAESYRIFADAEDGKAATIRDLMQKMNLNKRQATTLYEIYKPKK